MAFKMSYAFEGNFHNTPEQNLSGASKKQTREDLLQKAHKERQKRQDQRMKLHSTEVLQSYIRSYLARKQKKQDERSLYDQTQSQSDVTTLLSKLLFFYDAQIDDNRFIYMMERLIKNHTNLIKEMTTNNSLKWLIKRALTIALSYLNSINCKKGLEFLMKFATDMDILNYLLNKGYFKQLKILMEKNDDNLTEVLELIERPFNLLQGNIQYKDGLFVEFCNAFLSNNITSSIRSKLIPHLQMNKGFPYQDFIHFLNMNDVYEDTNTLLYFVLAMDAPQYEPNKDTINVLAKLSVNLLNVYNAIVDLTTDSDDEEEMEIDYENATVIDYINLFNNTDNVKKILHFLIDNFKDVDLLQSLIDLLQNLLLVSKKKFMLIFTLSVRGAFVTNLWNYIQKQDKQALNSTISLASWKPIYSAILVFCDIFQLFTETLTDSESLDTSKTFTNVELLSMCEMLKNFSLNLVELAFPICKSGTVYPSPQFSHLYKSCLGCLKVLHMLDLRKNFSPHGFWTKKNINFFMDITRRNYLSKRIEPFRGIVDDDEEEEPLPPLSITKQKSLAILQQLPFLIDFNVRVQVLRHLCYNSVLLSEEMRFHNEFMSEKVVVIRRTHLYEDAFDKLSNMNEIDLKQRVRIQFINTIGLEEAGIDGGGIFKEFLNEVLKTAFDPNRGFFLLTADNMLYPNPYVHLIVDNYWDHYYFIGRLIGKAIFDNILVDLPLAEFFLAKILVDKASAHYLKSLDPVLYRNLLYLRDYEGDVQDLGLDFTVINNDLGETRVVELKPNGRNIPVTNYNRLEYIHKLADLKLNQQIKKQCSAFRQGVQSVVSLLWLNLFDHHELQIIVGGDTQEMDVNDLRTHTEYGGEFSSNHITIKLFWDVLQNFTSTQKKQLLKFVTSCSRPPLLGFKELYPAFCIHSSGSDDRMPTASTCLNLLKLPIITEKETLKKKLIAAIEQQAGFELS